jgi:hypothetical protein
VAAAARLQRHEPIRRGENIVIAERHVFPLCVLNAEIAGHRHSGVRLLAQQAICVRRNYRFQILRAAIVDQNQLNSPQVVP